MRDDFTTHEHNEEKGQLPLSPYEPQEHHLGELPPAPPPEPEGGYRVQDNFDGPALMDNTGRQPAPYEAEPYRFSAERYAQPRFSARDYHPSSGSYNPQGYARAPQTRHDYGQPYGQQQYPAQGYAQQQGYGGYGQPYGAQQQTRVPPRPRKKAGPVVAVVLAVVLGLSLVSFAGYGAFRLLSDAASTSITDNNPAPQEPGNNGGGAATTPTVPPGEVPDINVNDRPNTNDGSDVSGSLTTPEIVKLLSPCVVEVTQYRESMPYTAYAGGSGIILSENGYIATNAHVVEGADTLGVTLSTGEEYDAIIVGVDSRTDLAVVKINAKGLPVAEFGNSSQLEIGERVVVIGNPGGMPGTVTQGVVSGLEREVPTSSEGGYSVRCVQTDAAINPGNSGGPLINQFGQVVGISSAKIVDINYEGIAFAISSNVALPVLRQLMEYGQVTGRVQLGIEGYEVTAAMAKMNDWPIGIVVGNIKNPDVTRAGVAVGDIITRINGLEAKSITVLRDEVAKCSVGDMVTLSVYRPLQNDESETFTVTVAVMADNSGQSSNLPG